MSTVSHPRPAVVVAVLVAIVLAVGSSGCSSPDVRDDLAKHAAVRPAEGAPSILSSLDELPPGIEGLLEPWSGDLDGMVERRVVRLLTVFSPMLYFLDGPEPRGIVYESAVAFERSLNESFDRGNLPIRVVIVPVLRDDLIPALVEGRGDLAAANLTITPERLRQVDFSDPMIRGVRELIVTAKDAPPLLEQADLAGRTIHVRRSSSYRESLDALNARLDGEGLDPVRIVDMPEYLEDDDLLEMVHAGLLPATVVDSHKAEFWERVLDGILLHPHLSIRERGEIAWAMRKDSPLLRDAVNRFVRGHRQGTLFGNVVLQRYLDDTRWMQNATADEQQLRFRGLAPLFREYADDYDLDWVLLAAQAFQESRLEQDRRSHRGAVGIMQLLPTTAAEMGIEDIEDVENNIHAGARYMRWILDTYLDDPALPARQRFLFALAAYNAGPNRLRDLRAEAAREGLDPDRWFDSVEVVAARRIGSETVRYVGNIVRYWVAYQLILERERIERRAIGEG